MDDSRNLRLWDHALSLEVPLMMSNKDVAGLGFGAGLSWNSAAFRRMLARLLAGGVLGGAGAAGLRRVDAAAAEGGDPETSLSLPLGVASAPALRRRSDAGIVDD